MSRRLMNLAYILRSAALCHRTCRDLRHDRAWCLWSTWGRARRGVGWLYRRIAEGHLIRGDNQRLRNAAEVTDYQLITSSKSHRLRP